METADPKFNSLHSIYASLFCATIIPVASLFYVLLRHGFPESSYHELWMLNGVSLLILSAPQVINARTTPSVVALMALLLCCMSGYLSFFTTFNFGIIFSFAGYVLWVYSFWKNRKQLQWSYLALLILGALILSLYIVGCVWGNFALSPTFTESLLVLSGRESTYVQDTVFHGAHAQMLRTYGAFSTGLDGLPLTYYHLGNHWIFGQLANLTQLPVMTLFNTGFPIIGIPVFLFCFIDFAVQVQIRRNVTKVSTFIFWFILLCLFMQVPKGLYSGGLLGLSIFNNESFVISLAFFFGLCSLLISFNINERPDLINSVILVPVLFIFASWCKISTGFVLSAFLGFLFFRLKGWKQLRIILSLLLCAVFFLVIYWLSVETIPFGIRNLNTEGTFEWFHFYTRTHEFKPFDWIFLFYFWMYLLFLLTALARKTANTQNTFLAAESALWVAFIGFIPSAVMSFSGGNSGYFAGIQLFFSGALVMAYSDQLGLIWEKATSTWNRNLKPVVVFLLLGGIGAFMWKEIRENHENMFKKNILTRKSLLGIQVNPDENIALFGDEMQQLLRSDVSESLSRRTDWNYISQLESLEKIPLKEKRQTILFKSPLDPKTFNNLNCIAETFLTPAYGGLVMMHGIPDGCSLNIYGEPYYASYLSGAWRSRISMELLTEDAKSRGYRFLQIYDSQRQAFRKISL